LFFTAVLSGMAVFFNFFVRLVLGKKKSLFKGTGMILIIAVSAGTGARFYAGAVDDTQIISKFCRDGSSYDIYGCIKEIEERKENGAVYVLLEHVRIEHAEGSMKIDGNVQVVFEEASTWLRPGRYIRLTGAFVEFQEPRNE